MSRYGWETMTIHNAETTEQTRQIRVGCEFQYTAEVETAAVFQVQPSGAAPTTILRQVWKRAPRPIGTPIPTFTATPANGSICR